MARPLRLEYAGALYHVTSRGDRREAIYQNDQDSKEWGQVLSFANKEWGQVLSFANLNNMM